VLIPQETEGPYKLDLSGNSSIFRQDVTEGRPGLPLKVVFTVVNVNDNCRPIPNARVDIWHCDKEGAYSGFSGQQPRPGKTVDTTGQTFMRGIQLTDSNGKAEFHTIYPGWYNGRITHIHFQVFISSLLKATSQGAFPDALNQIVYANPLYAEQNSSVANNAADMVFSSPASDLQYELFTIASNDDNTSFDGSLTVGIQAPASGIIELEPETGGEFKLQQNFPNPFGKATAIPFSLTRPSHVRLAVFDMNGKEVARLADRLMEGGEHSIGWDGTVAGRRAAAGNYLFQLTVENAIGEFSQARVMTLQ
jgi:protocatechuate 3,4-dioxygenase beta subunit